MSVGKVGIADTTEAVAASISLVGEVRGVRRGWWINQDRRRGESQQPGEQQIASQPRGEEVARLTAQQTWERREKGGRHPWGARVANAVRRVHEALEHQRLGSAR